jgi:hypothetical protein
MTISTGLITTSGFILCHGLQRFKESQREVVAAVSKSTLPDARTWV